MWQPALQLAQPVELEARGTDDDRGVGVRCLDRRERLDRLAEALLVGEEGTALLEQVADSCPLEGLQLARQSGHLERGIGCSGELHKTRRGCVLLAHLLQQLERLWLHPDRAGRKEGVELGHAEGIGADRGEPGVLVGASRPSLHARRQYTAQRGEAGEERLVVAGGEHEGRLLVHCGDLEHGRGHGTPVAESGHAALGGTAHPAVETRLDQLPGLEGQRDGGSPVDRRGLLPQRCGQTLGIAEQQEDGVLARSLHVDVAAPCGRPLQPGRDPRVDGDVLEMGEERHELLRVAFVRRQPKGSLGSLERAQVGLSGEDAGERSMLRADEDPVLAVAIATELHVIWGLARARVPLRVFRIATAGRPHLIPAGNGPGGKCAAGHLAKAQPSGLLAEILEHSRCAIVERHEGAPDGGHLARVGVCEQCGDWLRGGVGGEAQPPVLIGPGEVDEALVASAPGASATDQARQLEAHVRLAGEPGEEMSKSLGLVGFEGDAPGAPRGIPAAAGDRAQELAQVLVVGEAQHGLVTVELG